MVQVEVVELEVVFQLGSNGGSGFYGKAAFDIWVTLGSGNQGYMVYGSPINLKRFIGVWFVKK